MAKNGLASNDGEGDVDISSSVSASISQNQNQVQSREQEQEKRQDERPSKRVKISDSSSSSNLRNQDTQDTRATMASLEGEVVANIEKRDGNGDVEMRDEGVAPEKQGDEKKKQKSDETTTNGNDLGEDQLRELKAGIECFVDSRASTDGAIGFRGILKQRYTDFLVNEIALDGSVLHLTDDKAPKLPTAVPAIAAAAEKAVENKTEEPVVPEVRSESKTKPEIVAPAAEKVEVTVAEQQVPTATSDQETTKTTSEPAKTDDAEFKVTSEDEALLVDYFGEEIKNKVLEFHRKILAKPTAKPRDFGNILSEAITDRQKRGRLHADVRRIFKSRLETEFADGAIKVTAASQAAVKNHGQPANYANSNSQQQGGGRNNKNQTKGKLGWEELGGEYLHFTLYKENKDTMEVISHMSRVLRIKPKDFAFSGTKDRRAVTVQRVSIFRQRATELVRLNRDLRQARIGNFGYEKQPLSLGELNGNYFTIALRDCHFDGEEGLDEDARLQLAKDSVGKSIELAQKHGFINYYGLQRFGTFAISNDVVGAMILKNNFEGAVKAILNYNAALLDGDEETLDKVGRDDIARARAINMFEKTGRSGDALDLLPRRFNGETCVIRHLGNRNTKTDYIGALRMINRNLKLMYVHAYQSLVWNKAASKRWSLYGNKVVEGDLVIVQAGAEAVNVEKDEVDENGEIVIHPTVDDSAMKQDNFERARPLSAAEVESGKYTIYDVVLPTPGFDVEYPQNEVGDFYKSFMGSEEGGFLDPADMRRGEKDFSLSGNYRKLLNRMEDLSFEVKLYHGETEQLTQTDLEILEKDRPKTNNTYNGQQQNGRVDNRNQQNGQGGRGGFFNNNNTRGGYGQSGRGRYNESRNGQRMTGDIRLEDPNFATTKAPPANYAITNSVKQTAGPSKEEINAAKIAAWNGFHSKETAENKAREEERAARLARGEVEVRVEAPSPVIEETYIQTSFGQPGQQRQVISRTTTIIDQKTGSEEVKKIETPKVETIQEPVSTESTTMPPPPPSAANANVPPTAETTNESTSDNQTTTTTVESEGGGVHLEPKIAVIIKFALGPSTYATMALRELMKAGGVTQYKPDFSLGR